MRPGFDPWVGRCSGEEKGYPLQHSGLENSMDCIVHGVPKSRTWLSDFHSLKKKGEGAKLSSKLEIIFQNSSYTIFFLIYRSTGRVRFKMVLGRNFGEGKRIYKFCLGALEALKLHPYYIMARRDLSEKGWQKESKVVRIGQWNQLESYSVQFSSVQSLSRVQLFATPWIAARQASLSITTSWSTLRLTSIESMMPSSHLILYRPHLRLHPIPPSIRVFSNESTLHMRWPKYWNFSFRIIPSKEIPGLISFRMHWLDLLVVQGTLKTLLQHHSSKALILWCSAFFTQLSSDSHIHTGPQEKP